MTLSMSFTRSGRGVETNASETVTVQGSVRDIASPTILAAKAGTLTTRSSNTAGSLTMASGGHGITTGQIVDLFWSGGSCYGVTIGTVSGTTVPIASVVGGDNLPIATTVINVAPRYEAPLEFVGDNLKGIIVSASQEGYATFADGSGNILVKHITSTAPFMWAYGDPGTNPFASDTVTKVFLSSTKTTGTTTDTKVETLVA